MPNYDFKCVDCQETSESFFPIADGPSPAIVCPKCGKEAFRVYDATSAVFKGGGWGGSN